jgi:hypothetical protein
MYRIARILEVLNGAGYQGVENPDPGRYVCKSPHTNRPIVIPMGASDTLSDRIIRHLLRDEPDSDQIVNQMQD